LFGTKGRRHPHDRRRVRARRVRQDLPEVRVVGRLQLVLHDDHLTGQHVFAEQVQAEAADGVLRDLQLELHPEQL
jgi:hypothetical protein